MMHGCLLQPVYSARVDCRASAASGVAARTRGHGLSGHFALAVVCVAVPSCWSTGSLWQAGAEAIVLTTICDQMRYAAAYLHESGARPVFLFNVPSTWQNAGGSAALPRRTAPARSISGVARWSLHRRRSDLRQTMQRYDEARATVRGHWPPMSDGRYAEWLAELRDGGSVSYAGGSAHADRASAVPLALVGGPLLADDFGFLELVAAAGGQIVLDASEWGERTLPAPLDHERLVE